MRKMVLALCFLFTAFTTKTFLTAAQPVLDHTGEPLVPYRPYYIVSAIRGAGGGGVTLAAARNNSCSTDIVQERSDLAYGYPAIFRPTARINLVLESNRLKISFNLIPVCGDPVGSEWKVDDKDASTGQQFLSVGENEDGADNWFAIVKSGFANSYKLVYRPNDGTSQDVGRYSEGALRRLALSDNPFYVVFVKAEGGLLMKV